MGINIEPKLTVVPTASIMSATASVSTFTLTTGDNVTLKSTDKLIVIQNHRTINNPDQAGGLSYTPHPLSVTWNNENLTKVSHLHYQGIQVGSSVWVLDGPSAEAIAPVTITWPSGDSTIFPDGEGRTASVPGKVWTSPWNDHILAYAIRGAKNDPIVNIESSTANDSPLSNYSNSYTTQKDYSTVLWNIVENNNSVLNQMELFTPTPNYEFLHIGTSKSMYIGGHTHAGLANSVINITANVTANANAFTTTHFIEIGSNDTPTSFNAEKFGERLLGDGANISWNGDSLTNPQRDDRLSVASILECPVDINGVFIATISGVGPLDMKWGIGGGLAIPSAGGTQVVSIQYINQYANPQNNFFPNSRPFGASSTMYNGYEAQGAIKGLATGVSAVAPNSLFYQIYFEPSRLAFAKQMFGKTAAGHGITPATRWWPNTNFINDDSFSARHVYIEQSAGLNDLVIKPLVGNALVEPGVLFGTNAATSQITWVDAPIGKLSQSVFESGNCGIKIFNTVTKSAIPGVTMGISHLGTFLWSPSATNGVVIANQSYGSSNINDFVNEEHARDIDIAKFFEAGKIDTPIMWLRDGFVGTDWKTKLLAWINKVRKVHATARAADSTIRPLLIGLVSTYGSDDPAPDGELTGAGASIYEDQTKIAYEIAQENPDVFFVNMYRLVHEKYGNFTTPTKGGAVGWGVLPSASPGKTNFLIDTVHPQHIGARLFMRSFYQEVIKQANKRRYSGKKNIVHSVPNGETAFDSFLLLNHPGKYGQNNYIIDDVASIQKIRYSINSDNIGARLDIVMQGHTTSLQGMPGQNFGTTSDGNCLNIPDHVLVSLRRNINDPGGELDFTRYNGLKHTGVSDRDGVIRVNPVGFTAGDSYIIHTQLKF